MSDTEVALLGLLSPPQHHRLLGALFTTFSYDGPFFEEQVLPAIFGLPEMGRDAGRHASELHERLLEAPVHVWCDKTQFHGDKRLYGYDLHTMPPTFHPKVSLLVSESPTGVRRTDVLIASANLTKAGYRRNAEVAVTASSTAAADRELVADVVAFLRAINDARPVRQHAQQTLDLAAGTLAGPRAPSRRRFLGSGPSPILSRLLDLLEPDETIWRADVIAPSFERAADVPDASFVAAFAAAIRARSSSDGFTLDFGIPAPPKSGTTAFPIEGIADRLRDGTARLFAVKACGGEKRVPRRVHGKVIALETDRRCLVYCGSANFSAAALHLPRPPANWEAGVVLSFEAGTADELWPNWWGPLEVDDLTYIPAPLDEELIGGCVREASYHWGDKVLAVTLTQPLLSTTRFLVDDAELGQALPGDDPFVRRFQLDRLRRPVLLERDGGSEWWVPISIEDKDAVPVAPDIPQPPVEELLAVFARRRTRAAWDARVVIDDVKSGRVDGEPAPFDYLSAFLRAVPGIVEYLEEPVLSEAEYQARWRGSWGVGRVIDGLHSRLAAGGDYGEYVLMEALELRWGLNNLTVPEFGAAAQASALERLDEVIEAAAAEVDPLVAGLLVERYEQP